MHAFRHLILLIGAQITATDNRRMWGLQDEEALKGFASVVSVALENLQTARALSTSEL